MTSRNSTPMRALTEVDEAVMPATASDMIYRLLFGAIGWPWLLYSLWGGTKASKRRLMDRVGLLAGALPHLGSWKADTGFLHCIVDAVEELQPSTVVELGAGATTLVCAKALASNGGGKLYSFDQHAGFVEATNQWLREEGAKAELRHAALTETVPGWPGRWYDLANLPETIDLLIIDGPPWAVHPFVRGAAECLFDRLSPGAIVLLDDGARPGERVVARRWRRNWPDIRFELLSGGTKGTLIGRKAKHSAEILPFVPRAIEPRRAVGWQRAAAAIALFSAGWIAHFALGGISEPARAAEFIEEANASYTASQLRQRMQSQVETPELDRREIEMATGLKVPDLPEEWHLRDVQVYPSDLGVALAIDMQTDRDERVSLFATRAETPAEKLPLLERHDDRSLAYWEEGPMAYALTGTLESQRILSLAAELSRSQ